MNWNQFWLQMKPQNKNVHVIQFTLNAAVKSNSCFSKITPLCWNCKKVFVTLILRLLPTSEAFLFCGFCFHRWWGDCGKVLCYLLNTGLLQEIKEETRRVLWLPAHQEHSYLWDTGKWLGISKENLISRFSGHLIYVQGCRTW